MSDWIKSSIKNPGALTAKAKKKGKKPMQYASQVLNNPKKFDKTTIRQARLAKTLSGFNKGKK